MKSHPERFQECNDLFDVIFTVDRIIFMASRGAVIFYKLAKNMSKSVDLALEVYDLIEEVEEWGNTYMLYYSYLGPQ